MGWHDIGNIRGRVPCQKHPNQVPPQGAAPPTGLPVQILPDLVVAMERQGYTPAEVKGGYGYRSKEEDARKGYYL